MMRIIAFLISTIFLTTFTGNINEIPPAEIIDNTAEIQYNMTSDGYIMYPSFEEMINNIENTDDLFFLFPYERVYTEVDKFLNPDSYKDDMEQERYTALSGLEIDEYYFTYDNEEQKIYLNFNVTGSPFASIMYGWNRREIVISTNGTFVSCGDIGAYKSDAADALDKYFRISISYKFPEDTEGNEDLLCEYILSCLKSSGIKATYENIVSYGEEYLGMNITELPKSFLFDERRDEYWVGGHGTRYMPYMVIGEYTTPPDDATYLTVRFYSDYSCQIESHLYEYRVKNINGNWKLLSSTMIEYSPYEPGFAGIG